MRVTYDLTDQVFGRLTVIQLGPKGFGGVTQRRWECRCECGTTTYVGTTHLRTGHTKSCGCYLREDAKQRLTKHGMSGTKTYRTWQNMLDRCQNPENKDYARYGGRGITVDPRWESFEAFFADVGEAPPKMTLERRDNDAGYNRTNCVWVSQTKQSRNRNVTVRVEYNGVTKSLSEWAEETGIPRAMLYSRIVTLGWTPEQAFTEPAGAKRGPATRDCVGEKQAARQALRAAVLDGRLARPSTCTHPGCTETEVQAHHHKGYAPENALDVEWVCATHHPRFNEKLIEWQGRSQSVRQWSRETGIPYKLLRHRLRDNNWVADEKAFSPEPDRRSRWLTYQGVTKNIREWSKELGITMQTIIQRLKKGLPLDKVLSRGRVTAGGQP